MAASPIEPSEGSMEEFRAWLRANTTLSTRAVYDTVSRARRVSTMTDLLAPSNMEELRYLLSQNRDFVALPATVRSQLRRAAALFRRFAQEPQ